MTMRKGASVLIEVLCLPAVACQTAFRQMTNSHEEEDGIEQKASVKHPALSSCLLPDCFLPQEPALKVALNHMHTKALHARISPSTYIIEKSMPKNLQLGQR